MTKLEKQNKTITILRQIENVYRDMGEFLGQLKKTDKVELFDRGACIVYSGYLHPRVDDGEESDTDFCIETKDGQHIEFSVWELLLERTHFDLKNNILTLVIENVEVENAD